jgi:hypothetical protein
MALENKLLEAVRQILVPLVRILLRNGVASDAVTELVRKTFVDVAESEFSLPGKRQTNARISVITGLNRKEVARLRGGPPVSDAARLKWNRAATVLGAWSRDSEFLDRKGDPLDLPFEDASPSFAELVKKYSGDMQPRAVADELLRVDAIEQVDGGLRMTTRGYVPSSDPETVIEEILGIDTAQLIETIDHNILADADEKLFQLKVLATNMREDQVKEFNSYSRRLARGVIDELNIWLAERDMGKDWSGDDPRHELGLGIYQINRPVVRDRHPGSTDTEAESD